MWITASDGALINLDQVAILRFSRERIIAVCGVSDIAYVILAENEIYGHIILDYLHACIRAATNSPPTSFAFRANMENLDFRPGRAGSSNVLALIAKLALDEQGEKEQQEVVPNG